MASRALLVAALVAAAALAVAAETPFAADHSGVHAFTRILHKRRWNTERFHVPDLPRSAREDCLDAICDPLYPDQWHLHSTNITDVNVDVMSAWQSGLKGKGVLLSIVDDGADVDHPDLKDALIHSASYDFIHHSSTIKQSADDAHGTSCAGVAAARENSACGVGAARESHLGVVKILGDQYVDDATEAEALTYALLSPGVDIYSNSWGPYDDGMTLAPLSQVTLAAFEEGVGRGRGGKGSIYTWAAGNGAMVGDDCNMDGYVGSPYSIAVAALDYTGHAAYYSEACSSVFVTAPSSGEGVGITTTDRRPPYGYNPKGECTDSFGGTSSACPLAAGVIALILEKNSELTWRDVQGVLAHSSVVVDATDPGWAVNGAGLKVHHHYGFGLISAANAIKAAETWENYSERTYFETAEDHPNDVIDGVSGYKHTFNITADNVTDAAVLEHVQMVLSIEHEFRNQLLIELVSPSGTVSVLQTPHLAGELPSMVILEPTELQDYTQIGNTTGFGPDLTPDSDAANGLLVVVDSSNNYGCSDFTNAKLKNNIALMYLEPLDGCSAVSQVRRAQQNGATGVVFIVLYDGPLVYVDVGGEDTSNITIPSLQIDYWIGSAFYDYVGDGGEVLVALQTKRYEQPDFKKYPFLTVHNWGENPVGQWELRITDSLFDSIGTVSSVKLVLYGTGMPNVYVYDVSKDHDPMVVLIVIGVVLVVIAGVVVGVAYCRKKNDESYEVFGGDEF